MKFKEYDIRPEELLEKMKPALQKDIDFLIKRSDQFKESYCIACDSDNVIHWAEKQGFHYSRCNECETVFMNPRPTDEILDEFYKTSENYKFWNDYIFPQTEAARMESIFKPRAKKIIDICKKYSIEEGVLIEVGSAFGTFCEAIKEYNYFKKIIAVEPTPNLAETCRRKGIETHEETIEKLSLPESSADVVVNFEVIEHLGNPKEFIEKCVSFLKPNGLFICTCPSINGIGTLVLKEKAKVVDHEHLNYFTPESLKGMVENLGLSVLELLTPGELDVDLLVNAHQEDPQLFEGQDFIKQIIKSDDTTKNTFQEFLKNHNLSSHLWMISRKT